MFLRLAGPLMINLTLVGQDQVRVRKLAGFRKSHRVPAEDSPRTRAFVHRIAVPDLEADLDHHFAAFRDSLGFRRIELEVSDPADGCASIGTPLFRYQVSIRLFSDDPAWAVREKRLDGFADIAPLLRPDLEHVFPHSFSMVEVIPHEPPAVDELIDTLETRPLPGLKTDYDRTATWVELSYTEPASACLRVQADCIRLQAPTPLPPRFLLQSYLRLQKSIPAVCWMPD